MRTSVASRRTGACALAIVALALTAAAGARADPAPPRMMRVLSRPDPGAGESPVTRSLAEYLQQAQPGEFVPIIVLLKRQLSEKEKIAAVDSLPPIPDRADLKEARRRVLVNQLRKLAAMEQRRLRDSLAVWDSMGVVRRVRPLWLIDAIGMEAAEPAVLAMSGLSEVASISLDLPRPALVVSATPTWNVEAVKAPDVWNRTAGPYTGDGVVVGLLDSGVDYTQRDLENRIWINGGEDTGSWGDHKVLLDGMDGADEDPLPPITGSPLEASPCDPPSSSGSGGETAYPDDGIGWDFVGGDNDPTDVLGHGTWMAGVIAGDGTAGTGTGVAPGAQLMALKCVSDASGGVKDSDAWEGMQYALAKGASIVNASLGISNCHVTESGTTECWDPSYDGWFMAVENLMDAGVLFATATGNENNSDSPEGYQVTIPGSVPAALTLGGTDESGDRWDDDAEHGSNYGPVNWEESSVTTCVDGDCSDSHSTHPYPPGLMKPDVMAPARPIQTTKIGRSGYTDPDACDYTTYDCPPRGTSYSAAHASGVAALLLEEDPGLTPYEIKFILEETATAIGDSDRQDETGWGLLDARAAIDYTLDRTSYDLAVTGTSALWTTEDIWVDNNDDGTPDTPKLGPGNHLYARIRNLKGEVPSNVEVKFFYADVATIGISGFDPNGDGDPCDGDFTYIGSCRIPTIGPAGSRLESAIAMVDWTIPDPGLSHWCVGIGIIGGNAANHAEGVVDNNVAFRNFFELETSTAAFPFWIAPPHRAPTKPFSLEILKRNLPASVTVELKVPEVLSRRSRPEHLRLLPRRRAPVAGRPWSAFVRSRDLVDASTAYRVEGDRAILRRIVCPDGKPVRGIVVVHSSEKLPPAENRYVIVNAVDASGRPVGGFTLKIVDRK